MSKRAYLILLAAAGWLVFFVVAVLMAAATERTGDGFTRGLNRVEVFFQWQLVSIAAAVAAAVLVRKAGASIPVAVRRIGYAPLVIDGLLIIGIVLVFVGALIFN